MFELTPEEMDAVAGGFSYQNNSSYIHQYASATAINYGDVTAYAGYSLGSVAAAAGAEAYAANNAAVYQSNHAYD